MWNTTQHKRPVHVKVRDLYSTVIFSGPVSLTPSGSLGPSDKTTNSSSDSKQTAWRMFINDREQPATRSFPLLSISAKLSALYQVCITGWHQMLSTHPVPLTAIAKYGCGTACCGRVGGRRPAPLHALKDFQRMWALRFLSDLSQTGENILIRNIFTICTVAPGWWSQTLRMYKWLHLA